MTDITRIVVYGSSSYMAGLAVSLMADPMLDVIHIQSCAADVMVSVEHSGAHVVILDFSEVPVEVVLQHLRSYPGQILVGVDLASEDILLLSGQRFRVVTMTDMIQLIKDASDGYRLALPAVDSATTGE